MKTLLSLMMVFSLSGQLVFGGADVGGTIEYFRDSKYSCYSDMYDCLDKVPIILDKAAGISNMLAAKKRYSEARRQLMIGVNKALSFMSANDFSVYPSLTVIGLLRTKDLDAVFTNNCSGEECYHQNRRAFNAVKIYVGHIRNHVYQLDVGDYYTSMSTGYCSTCYQGYNNPWQVFLEKYKDLAVESLRYITGQDGSSMPDILARDEYEARVSELIFRWAAEDLYRDDMRRLYRSEFQILMTASENLADFNNGELSIFANARMAAEYARNVASDAYSRISSIQCSDNDGSIYGGYRSYDNHRGSVYSKYLNRLPRRINRADDYGSNYSGNR